MKDNSKCALKINEIGVVLFAILIIAFLTNTQLLKESNERAQIAEDDIQQNEQQIEVAKDEYERDVETTTRSELEREIIEEPKYISIDEVEISKDMDLTIRCGLSKEDFVQLLVELPVDRSGFFAENAEYIYDLCEEYELNEIFFCGLIAGESGWNIVSSHRNKHNYISMMSGGSMIRFDSEEEGLEAAARLLHNKYLSEDGAYFRGTTLYDIQKIFCPGSSTWVGLIYGCMSQML